MGTTAPDSLKSGNLHHCTMSVTAGFPSITPGYLTQFVTSFTMDKVWGIMQSGFCQYVLAKCDSVFVVGYGKKTR